jgi:thiol-disulfide isomerase/thioredoxin
MWTRLRIAALVGVLALSGCGGSGKQAGSDQQAAAASASASAEPAQDEPAKEEPAQDEATPGPAAGERVSLAFKGKTVDGKSFDGATLAGKAAVLWFWAPWCTTCKRQSSDVRTFAQKYAGKVSFVGVAGLDKLPAMKTFVATNKLDGIPHLDDEAGVVWKQFRITQQSTYVLVSADGGVVDSGIYDDESLEQKLRKLVG